VTHFHRIVAAALALGAVAGVPAHGAPPNPYMGDSVAQTTAPNGALMNANLAGGRGAAKSARVVAVRPGVWVLRDFSIVNCTIVETTQGLVVFDSGTSVGQGETFLAEIRKLSPKPVIAIIYSHFHYTAGASAFLAGRDPKDLLVIGHPKLEANADARSLTLAPSTSRRSNMQFGAYLPKSGADAGIAPPSPKNIDPAKLANGHLKVNHTVQDGEKLTIGGTEFQFFHAQGDTDDTLTVWIPGMSTVLTNVTSQAFFALYTLRGESYREPQAVIDSYDTIRRLKPEYYVPTHGDVLTGAPAIYDRMTAHRDAYSYTFNQAIRGLNKGWGPDELVARIELPEHLLMERSLYQGYSEFDFALRGIYRGLIGWYGEDAAEMHPPRPDVLGAAVVQGFGGIDALVKRSREALDRREFALAAKLANYGVAAEPGSAAARQAKADALRAMAQVAFGSQSYNFLLTEARHLEGKIDVFKPVAGDFGAVTFDTVAGSPARALVSVLESRIDPEKARGTVKAMTVRFDDVKQPFTVAVRRGVAEVSDGGDPAALQLSTSRKIWFDLVSRKLTVAEAVQQGWAKVSGGSASDASAFLGLFDRI